MSRTKVARCQALGSDGVRCRREAINLFTYHGDDELYGGFSDGTVTWVVVHLCSQHADGVSADYSESSNDHS